MSISVVYWSGTGNTQAMAEAVAEGIKAAGQEAELLEVGDADAKTVAAVDAFALGCPAMGAEVLEDPSLRFLWMGRRRMDERLGRPHEKRWGTVDP